MIEETIFALRVLTIVVIVLFVIGILAVAWAGIERHSPPRDELGRFRRRVWIERLVNRLRGRP